MSDDEFELRRVRMAVVRLFETEIREEHGVGVRDSGLNTARINCRARQGRLSAAARVRWG